MSPRGEFVHETFTLLVDEQSAVAAQPFREERPRFPVYAERRRVELDELEVGDGRSGTQRDGDAVAGRLCRIRRHVEEHAGTACREHDRVGIELDPSEPAVETGDAAAPTPFDDEVGDEDALEHGDAARREGRRERPGHLGTGRHASRVDHACHGMATLAGAGELAPAVEVEHGAPPQEHPHRDGPLGDEHPHRVRVGKATTGAQRVSLVELDRVVVDGQRGGDPPLGPSRRRLAEPALGDKPDTTGAALDEFEGRRAPGDAAADDERVERLAPDLAVHRTTRRLSINRTCPTRAAMRSTTSPASAANGSRWPSATGFA